MWDFTDRGHSFCLIGGCFLRELGPKGSQALLIWRVKLGAVNTEGKSHQTLGGALRSLRTDNEAWWEHEWSTEKGRAQSRFEPSARRMDTPASSVRFINITNSFLLIYYRYFWILMIITILSRVSSTNT